MWAEWPPPVLDFLVKKFFCSYSSIQGLIGWWRDNALSSELSSLGYIPDATINCENDASEGGSATTPWLFSQYLGYSLFTLASWFSIGFLLFSSLFRNLVNSWLFSLAHLGSYENEE